MKHLLIACASVALLASARVAAAEQPPAPLTRDAVVATDLLPATVKANVRALAAASDASRTEPQRLARAQSLVLAGRASGDPRTLGYAEAMLQGLPDSDDVLVLRATIEQSRHRFAQAQALLDRVLVRTPLHPQALLTRATVSTVTGAYPAAREDCARLARVHGDVALLCAAQVAAVTGGEARAAQLVQAALGRVQGDLRSWALALQGQLSEQAGENAAAERAYRAVLEIGEDLTTRLALADVVLALGRAQDALAVLQAAPPADGVLLRRWRAAPDAALAAQLARRIEAAQLRGELLHARDAAQFALAQGRTSDALRLAQENWQSQREPADLRLLALAGQAAKDQAVIDAVRAWRDRTGLRDAQVDAILKEVRS